MDEYHLYQTTKSESPVHSTQGFQGNQTRPGSQQMPRNAHKHKYLIEKKKKHMQQKEVLTETWHPWN